MTDVEQYRELGTLTKNKEAWEEKIPYVASLLASESVKIKAKALWLLGEMGLRYPQKVKDAVTPIATFFDSSEPILRERAVIALGRIGRGDYRQGAYHLPELHSETPTEVEQAIGRNCASLIADGSTLQLGIGAIPNAVLSELGDKNDLGIHSEMFRVLGKRRPHFVKPYFELLHDIPQTDSNRVVRIHCLGAIRAAGGDSRLTN